MLTTIGEAQDVAVPLPPHLARYGAATTARLCGRGGPVVLALGGISADRFVCTGKEGGPGWWRGLVGEGCAIDPARARIVGLDFAADAAGAHAPSTTEQAEVVAAALDAFGLDAADLLLGASYGGMVGLALAQQSPARVRRLAIVSAPAVPHPAATAMRELQRRTVAMGLALGSGAEALSIARGLAMLTYRTPEEFEARFSGGIAESATLATSEAGAYLRARGDAYRPVMSPERFLSLSASIDRHCVDPSAIAHPTLVLGARSDRLVPPQQLEALAAALPDAELHLLDSLYGHDAFLKETALLAPLVAVFLGAA
jgi:homoserine O-acetyltransferase/O-succinyltransferase